MTDERWGKIATLEDRIRDQGRPSLRQSWRYIWVSQPVESPLSILEILIIGGLTVVGLATLLVSKIVGELSILSAAPAVAYLVVVNILAVWLVHRQVKNADRNGNIDERLEKYC